MNLHTRTMIPRQSSKLRASCCSREAINLFELALSTVYKTRLERYIPPPIVRSDTLARGSMCSAPPVNRRGGALCVGWLQGAARCLLYKSWPGPAPQEKTEGRKEGRKEAMGEERLISFLKLGYDLSGFRLPLRIRIEVRKGIISKVFRRSDRGENSLVKFKKYYNSPKISIHGKKKRSRK